MAQTFSRVLAHVVFSTKNRRGLLKDSWHDELFSYMGGIVHNLGGKPQIINGMADHVHLLLSLRATVNLGRCAPSHQSKIFDMDSATGSNLLLAISERPEVWEKHPALRYGTSGLLIYQIGCRGLVWAGRSPAPLLPHCGCRGESA